MKSNGMRKAKVGLAITALAGLLAGVGATAAFASNNDNDNDNNGSDKVFVCKYVDTPGVDERLQTGQNPIEVAVQAIPGWEGKDSTDDIIGYEFADKQGRSIVIALSPTRGDGQRDEPTIEDCPPPDSPPEMVEVCDPDTMMVIEVPLGTEGDYKPVEFCDEDPVKPVLSIDAQCVDPNVETAIGFKLDIANADPNTTYVGVTVKTADYTGPWASGLFPVVADAISYPFVFAVGDEITVQAYADEDLTQRIGEPVTHTVEACDVEKPELPDPKVTVTGTSQCVVPLNGKAMMVTTTTTTPYKWDGDVAVLDEANAEEVITTTEVDDEGCVPPPPNEVKVCDVDTGELINVPEGTEGDYAPVTDEACNPTTPEEPKTPEVPKTPDTPTRTVKTD